MKREGWVVCGWKISLGKFASLFHYLELSWGQIPHGIERKAALAPEPSCRNVSLQTVTAALCYLFLPLLLLFSYRPCCNSEKSESEKQLIVNESTKNSRSRTSAHICTAYWTPPIRINLYQDFSIYKYRIIIFYIIYINNFYIFFPFACTDNSVSIFIVNIFFKLNLNLF